MSAILVLFCKDLISDSLCFFYFRDHDCWLQKLTLIQPITLHILFTKDTFHFSLYPICPNLQSATSEPETVDYLIKKKSTTTS